MRRGWGEMGKGKGGRKRNEGKRKGEEERRGREKRRSVSFLKF